MASYVDYHHHHHRYHHMTEDLLIEILIRLPLKSLLQFKSVCKYWYSLIKSSNFVCKHVHYQKRRNNGRLLLQHYNNETNHWSYTLFPDETLASGTYHDLDHHLQLSDHSMHIEGPIDGLFCLFNQWNRIIMWSPAMREFRTLPFPHPIHPPGHLSNTIGFGLDPLTGDTKVVLIWHFLNGRNAAFGKVYTLRTNTWRHLDGLDFLPRDTILPYCNSNTYLNNGVYHWWVDYPKRVVLAFNMGTEVFREISGPPGIPKSDDLSCSGTLTSYNDDLIALILEREITGSEIGKWIDIWVMEEEGCWIKQFAVGPLPASSWQLGFWKNGELLLEIDASQPLDRRNRCSHETVLYNPSTQKIRALGPKGGYHRFQAVVYYESLVSVKGRRNDL